MEVLELPNFFHMNKSAVEFESRNEILLVTSSLGMMASLSLFQNTVILRRPGVAIFADIIKIITRFIKKMYKVSELESYQNLES